MVYENIIEATEEFDSKLMRETQEDYYLVLFMFASQLYFYVLGPISLLGYWYFNLEARLFL